MKFPGGWMFGAMLGSGTLHALGIVQGILPIWVINIAMIGIGATVGTRFATIGFATFLRYLVAGIGSLAVSLAIIAVFLCSPCGLPACRCRTRRWRSRRARWM
jgi:uncharacterized membrane protein AbrB (regulator of aidB expression)